MSQFKLNSFFKAIIAVIGTAGLVWCQTETGQITGTVTDPTGAAIQSATVDVKSLGTGANRTVTTGSSGDYSVTNLLPGEYNVSASASGFARTEQRVTVAVGGRVGQDFKLEVGTSSAVVEVSASAVQVNTDPKLSAKSSPSASCATCRI